MAQIKHYSRIVLCENNEKGKIKIINKKLINNIIPYSREKILVDYVIMTADHAVGLLKIRHKECRGHVVGGIEILPGHFYPEMAAQLLGITIANLPELSYLHEKIFYAERYNGIEFEQSSYPEELIRIYFSLSNIKILAKNKGRRYQIIATNFKIEGEDHSLKAKIGEISLGAMEKELFIRLIKMSRKTNI